jgi:hypothetical protein
MNPRSFAISSYEGSVCCFVSNDLLEVGTLARQGNITTPIRPITGQPSLFPASSACTPHSVSCDYACLTAAEEQVYRVSLS